MLIDESKKRHSSFAQKDLFMVTGWMFFHRFINEIPDENIEKNSENLNEKLKDDFDFNQDLEIENTGRFDEGFRSPGYTDTKNKILNGKNNPIKKAIKKPRC